MSISAREMFDNLVGDLDKVKGSVNMPAKFDDSEESITDPLPESTLDSIKDIRNGHTLVPRVNGFKSKVSAKLFGFFFKYSMAQQTELNLRYAMVSEEFVKLNEQKRELAKKIDNAKRRLEQLESAGVVR